MGCEKRGLSDNVPRLYIGPTTFVRFLRAFESIYAGKSRSRTEEVTRLQNALVTLERTRTEIALMKKEIEDVNKLFVIDIVFDIKITLHYFKYNLY